MCDSAPGRNTRLRKRCLAHSSFPLAWRLPMSPRRSFFIGTCFRCSGASSHPCAIPWPRRSNTKLADIVPFPLIMYERGSTGRQHVAEAFQRRGLSPHVEIEATNTDLIVRMVEAGLGVAVVPLHPSGAVTRGRRVV